MGKFSFSVKEIDGHNIDQIISSFDKNKLKNKPNIIICHTVKGKGFPFAEHNPSWHHKSKMSTEEINLMYECLKN